MKRVLTCLRTALGALAFTFAALPSSATVITVNGDWTAGDPTLSPRPNRNGVVATCAAPKAYAGTLGGAWSYDIHTFFNNGPADCITVTHVANVPNASLFVMAYEDFDALSAATDYLGDGGSSGLPISFSINVPAFSSFDLVAFGAVGLGNYEFTVEGRNVILGNGVPLPGTLALVSLPLLAIGAGRRRRIVRSAS